MAITYNVYAADGSHVVAGVTYEQAVEAARAHVAEAASVPPHCAHADICRVEPLGFASSGYLSSLEGRS